MKTVPQITPADAAAMVPQGARLMVGGFGMTGNPVNLLHALAEIGTGGLTYISNNIGEPGLGGGRMLRNGQIEAAIGSFFTSNPEAVQAAQEGRIEIELIPQGSFTEAIRAGGAGIGGFWAPSGVGTSLAEGAETREIDGAEYLFVPALRADVAFIRAWQADTAGNLVYRRTEQNFNRVMATAADLVIAEVEEIVPAGDLAPEAVHTPGIYVDFLVKAPLLPEHLGTSGSVEEGNRRSSARRMAIARRALAELRPGEVVNLGVGIPTLIADLIEPDAGITLHTENGMLGVGPSPQRGGALEYPVNAGKIPVTVLPGSSYFGSADSFAMIRGGHVDVAVMGGLQVDQDANLSNWAAPDQPLLGVGGAMDLAQGARRLIIAMIHTQRDGSPKIVPACSLPLTARNAVDTVVTDLGVFRFPDGKLTLVEVMPGSSLEEIRAKTSAEFDVLLRD